MLIKNLLFILSLLLLSACGSSGSSDSGDESPTASIGVFIDSPVSGLGYQAKSFSGKTNDRGEFNYLPGEMVTFFIGNITIGSQIGAPVISPLSLVEGAQNEQNLEVTNIVRLLMTLDADKNAANGIRISDEVTSVAEQVADNSIDFSLTTFSVNPALSDFIRELPTATTLVDAPTAQEHFAQTLRGQSKWGEMVWGSGVWQSAATD